MSDKQLELKKETALQENTVIDYGLLFQEAVKNPQALEVIKELTALKNAEEDRLAKKEFDFHFVKMQKDYQPATKTKAVKSKDGTKTLYSYCPLESILKVYAPILAKHGFTYRWEVTQNEKTLDVTCIISGYGWETKNTVNIPIQAGTSFTNDIQQRGAAISYGKRYSFINAVGVIIEGEDTDGKLSIDETLEYAEEIKALNKCQTPEVLHAKVQEVAAKMKEDGDTKGREIIRKYYTKRKEELKRNKQ